MERRHVRIGLRIFSFVVMAFLYIPLVVIVMASFNASRIPTWPIKDYTLHWWSLAMHDQTARTALENSFKVGLAATAVALVLGSAAAFALARFSFFGRNSLSLLLVLPIALPGIVTGLSLLSAIEYLSLTPSLVTVAIGHSTFCIVVVFNNAVARLRRSSSSFEEASMDLGADGWQTFASSPCRTWPPRWWRVACSRSRCRSTRSWSPTSRPAPSRRCRCGSTTSSACPTRRRR